MLVSTDGIYLYNAFLASDPLKNVEQPEETTFDDFLDKINKLSKRVRELEESIFWASSTKRWAVKKGFFPF